MTELLNEILKPEGLSWVLQPVLEIRDGRRSVHSMECLTRGPVGTSAESAEVLFAYIRLKQREISVDRLCLAGALRAATQLPEDLLISFNVHTSTLSWDDDFVQFVAEVTDEIGIDPTRLILEVVEHQPVRDANRLVQSLDRLRHLGLQIAVDDIGAGHSTFKRLLDCDPDFFKIDRSVIHGCHQDHRRRAMIQSISLLACELGAQVVAEGVEDSDDLETVLGLDIHLAQGFALSRPLALEDAQQFLLEHGPSRSTDFTEATDSSAAATSEFPNPS